MAAYHLNLAGLFLDVIGVFLLSVEAIKLPNLRNLRDKVSTTLRHSVVGARIEIPRSVRKNRRWRHNPDWIVIESWEARHFHRTMRHFLISHYLAGMFGSLFVVAMLQASGINIFRIVRDSLGMKTTAIILGVHIVYTLLGLLMVDQTAKIFPMTIIPFIMAALMMLYPPSLIFMLMGEALHIGTIRLFRYIISYLDMIDRKTPDGTIGIAGFLFALVGFVLQFIGSWLSAGR